MHVDDRALAGLIEESQDLHTDAMQDTRRALNEIVELGHERPDTEQHQQSLLAHGLGGGRALAAAGVGGALLAIMSRPAFAAQSTDVQMLQTAASIENLAIATYGVALTLPFAGALPKVVQTFATTTKSQHTEHAAAFNAALKALGAPQQTNPDPVLLQVVNNAKPKLTGPAPLIDLAIQLEMGAAETYVKYVGAFTDKNARNVTASIMGVEAQHVAIL
ncbi:MAG TPA: ferritin-like domain-containing protein, partial [Acidimicrobiia bacterium]|nr:ferritin-like domain-containing protein [Acidimicrobiia bacterium]